MLLYLALRMLNVANGENVTETKCPDGEDRIVHYCPRRSRRQ